MPRTSSDRMNTPGHFLLAGLFGLVLIGGIVLLHEALYPNRCLYCMGAGKVAGQAPGEIDLGDGVNVNSRVTPLVNCPWCCGKGQRCGCDR